MRTSQAAPRQLHIIENRRGSSSSRLGFTLCLGNFSLCNNPLQYILACPRRWISKISYLTYAFAAVIISQFDAIKFYGPEVSAKHRPACNNSVRVGGGCMRLGACMGAESGGGGGGGDARVGGWGPLLEPS